jgi:tetratricopeptide (TPR) repeat protein
VFVLFAIFFLMLLPSSAAQTASSSVQDSRQSPTKRPHVDQSVVVGAHLTPEEVEEGNINDIYQPIYHFQQTGDCEGIVRTAQSAVIPAAEQAKFETVRKKFLFLSYRSIGDCIFKAKEYAEAEQTYIKAVDYADKDDSSYAINFESIALCRMAQQHLESAEEPLRKAVSLLADEITRLKKSDTYNTDDIVTNDVRGSQDVALLYLAVLCFREERSSEALSLLDQAYDQAIKFQARAQIIKRIVETGQAIATAVGDDGAKATWTKRTPISK